MIRITERQKIIYDFLVTNDEVNLEEMRRAILPNISRQAIHQSVRLMIDKGYLRKQNKKKPKVGWTYVPTGKGLSFILKHGQETKRTVWDEAGRVRKAGRKAKATVKRKQDTAGANS